MDTIRDIALSLASGAAAVAGKDVVSALVKDGYAKLKALVLGRYPNVSLTPLEQSPASKAQREVLVEDLAAAGAAQDAELVAAAQHLLALIAQHAPQAAAAIGVALSDVSAANLRLADIVATGSGVVVQRGTFSGDIDIKGVRAGVKPGDPAKGG